MTAFTNIPKHVEEALQGSSRREFLKTSGMLVVSFGVGSFAGAAPFAADASCSTGRTQSEMPV